MYTTLRQLFIVAGAFFITRKTARTDFNHPAEYFVSFLPIQVYSIGYV